MAHESLAGRSNRSGRERSNTSQVGIVNQILAGAQHIASFPECSQYVADTSACSLATFNCARILLGRGLVIKGPKELLVSTLGHGIMEVRPHHGLFLCNVTS
jgi:hypothetical protein